MSLEKETTGVVLLGASEFPDSEQFKGSEAFLNANVRIKEFFTGKFYNNDKCDLILDLFDADLSPGDILLQLTKFIKKKSSTLKDLIIYYVGHGGFDKEFLLVIRKTNDVLLSATSLTSKSLGSVLTDFAFNLKIYLVLDCCFAGEMYTKFQSPIDQLVNKQFSENFPESGIALLCSSSKDKPSVIIEDRSITMFTEGFEKALNKGDPFIKNKYLTLREIRNLTYTWINQYNSRTEVVRPEVHTPYMPSGDIADIPLFLNYGFNPDGLEIAYNFKIRLHEIQKQIINNNLKLAASLFVDFVNDVDHDYEYILEATLLAAECNALEDERPLKNSNDYKEDSDEFKKENKAYAEARTSLYRRILEFCYKMLKKFK